MSFWDPVAFSWPVMAVLIIGTIVLTIGFAVWYVLQPEEPDFDTKKIVKKATDRDRREADLIAHRLDAEAGREDSAHPELR